MRPRPAVRSFARLLKVACLLLAIGWPSTGLGEEPGPREWGRVSINRIREPSGIAVSRQNPGILWMHNDGATQEIFAVRTDGTQACRIELPLAVVDPEDIAIGPGPEGGKDYLYLADIGDNDARRPSIRLLRMLEPELPPGNSGKLRVRGVEYFRLAYPDGPCDAEAMFVDPTNGDVWIFTKERRRARAYVTSAADLEVGPTIELRLAAILDHVQRVSAGDISRDGQRIILRTEARGWLWDRPTGRSVALAISRAPSEIAVLGETQGANGEAVAFDPDGLTYWTISEGRNEIIFSFPLPAAAAEEGR